VGLYGGNGVGTRERVERGYGNEGVGGGPQSHNNEFKRVLRETAKKLEVRNEN